MQADPDISAPKKYRILHNDYYIWKPVKPLNLKTYDV